MIAFFAIWFLLITLMTAVPTVMLKKRQRILWWDYAYPFSGVAVWLPLSMFDLGSTASLSNFVVEVFWITVVSVAIPWTRWILSRFQIKRLQPWLLILTFLPIAAAVVLRLTMPTLPE